MILSKKYIVLIGICAALLSGFVFVIFHKQILAQDDAEQALEISPPSQELEVQPGQAYTITAAVRNKSNDQLPIAVRIEDFVAEGDEGQVALVEKGPWSVSQWTNITPDSFDLDPGETQKVTATIRIPKTGAAGGRYGSIVFSVKGQKEAGAAAVSQEVASLFLVRIAGTVEENVELNSFTAPKFSEYGPIPFALKFKNKGNVHTRVYGLVNVSNMFGQKVADVVVPPTNIFPDAERIVQAQLEKKVLIGRYKAVAVMYYGAQSSTTLNAETTFFVFPYKITGIAGAVIILLFLIRKRLKKAFKVLFK